MLSGDRSNTATGGDGDDTVPLCDIVPRECDTVPCVGRGDFDTKPFVRAHAAAVQEFVSTSVSSSDSVRSITHSSVPLAAHVTVEVAAADDTTAGTVVAAAGATGRCFLEVSAPHTNIINKIRT